MILAALDLGINRTGFCHGDTDPAAGLPRVEGWRFDNLKIGEDYGRLGGVFWRRLDAAHRRTPFDRILFEAPLLDRFRDKLRTIRITYGMGMILETWAEVNEVPIEECEFGEVKLALAGNRKATKDDQVRVAERMGFTLPARDADGREDAADAVGVFLRGVELYSPRDLPGWDKRRLSRLI